MQKARTSRWRDSLEVLGKIVLQLPPIGLKGIDDVLNRNVATYINFKKKLLLV
jgi:hypothetical protein